MSGYVKCFDETKYMAFLITYEESLEDTDNINNVMKKEPNSELVYNEKYLKTKIKFHDGKVNKNVHHSGVPKEGYHCICLQ